MRRPIAALAGSLPFLALLFTACAVTAQEGEDRARPVEFVCNGGARFLVEYQRDRVRITTSQGIWLLNERRSSIGRRFGSETAAFIHDEDRGALNGLPGGPFRRCREASSDSAA